MKPEEFTGNSHDMRYEYHRVREGPNYFVSYYKHSSRLHYDPKDTWRTLGVAKFTDSGKALKQWCLDLHQQYGAEEAEGEARSDTSFASEAMEEGGDSHPQGNPQDNTRMVT